jgi:hypothetical protein
MLLNEKIVYFENLKKFINTFWKQNAELLVVKAGGTHSCHWTFKELSSVSTAIT